MSRPLPLSRSTPSTTVSTLSVSRTEGDGDLELPKRPDVDAGESRSVRTLDELLCELPDDLAVPVRWVRDRLELDRRRTTGRGTDPKEFPNTVAQALSELSADEYGRRRMPPRTAEWVRDACRTGAIPGARKEGSAWLIPANALTQEPNRARTSRGRSSRDGIGKPATARPIVTTKNAQLPHARW